MSAASPGRSQPDLDGRPARLKLAARPRRRARGAAGRHDPALAARGAAAHPGRGRARRPRRGQRAAPPAGRRLPGRQEARRVPGRRSRPCPGPPSTTSPRSSGSAPPRTCAWSVPPAPARATCSSRLGLAAVEAGLPRPLPRRPRPRRDPLPGPGRQLASAASSTALLRTDLVIVDELGFAPLDDTGAQLLFRFVAAAYERRSLGVASHWPFDAWGRFLPEHTTAASLLDRLLHHAVVVVTEGESFRMKEARSRGGASEEAWPSRVETSSWPPVETFAWPLTAEYLAAD